MKKTVTMAIALGFWMLTSLMCPRISEATLIVESSGNDKVVYATTNDTYWVWDVNAFSDKTYAQQVSFIQTNYADTHYFGIDNWHLASLDEFDPAVRGTSTMVTDMLPFNPTYTNLHLDGNPPYENLIWDGRVAGLESGGVTSAPYLYMVVRLDTPSTAEGQWYLDTPPDGAWDGIGAWVVGTAPAVPEPASCLLVGAGLALASLLRKRHNG